MATHVTNRTWTEQDMARLKEMVETGISAQRASVAFRRSIVAVKSQAKKGGFPFPDERMLKRKRQGQEIEARHAAQQTGQAGSASIEE